MSHRTTHHLVWFLRISLWLFIVVEVWIIFRFYYAFFSPSSSVDLGIEGFDIPPIEDLNAREIWPGPSSLVVDWYFIVMDAFLRLSGLCFYLLAYRYHRRGKRQACLWSICLACLLGIVYLGINSAHYDPVTLEAGALIHGASAIHTMGALLIALLCLIGIVITPVLNRLQAVGLEILLGFAVLATLSDVLALAAVLALL